MGREFEMLYTEVMKEMRDRQRQTNKAWTVDSLFLVTKLRPVPPYMLYKD